MKIGVSLPVREMQDDLESIVAFAQLAEELEYNHLRVPDMVLRPKSGHLHESMTLLAYIAAVTKTIRLVPSVIALPARQTVQVAKQAAGIDVLSGGRFVLGVGVGGSKEEYAALGRDFTTRGARCDEQLQLLKLLWTQENMNFDGKWETVQGLGLNPLPVQRPIPIWIGAASIPSAPVIRRIGAYADGWYVLCSPEEFPDVKSQIDDAATNANRDPADIHTEAGVAVVGPREAEWKDRVKGWREIGLNQLCLRTLGGGLNSRQHLDKLKEINEQIPRG